MITLVFVRPQGGLGNQLFFFNQSLLRSLSTRPFLIYSTTWFDRQSQRSLRFPFEYIHSISLPRIVDTVLKIFSILHTKSPRSGSIVLFRFLQVCFLDDIEYTDQPVSPQLTSRLPLQPFPYSHLSYNLAPPSIPNVAFMHIRRGDYLKHPNSTIYTALSTHYYNSSLSYLASQCRLDVIFVFAESESDIALLHDLPQHLTYKVYTKLSDLSTLRLMSSVHHAILANSTLSYWGAKLLEANSLTNSKIIAPSSWFLSSSFNNTYIQRLIPSNWTKISND